MPEGVWSDVRLALRRLVTSPGFALAALVTLALGVGSATAIFAAADAVFLRPPPFPEPGRLVDVTELDPRHGASAYGVSYPAYLEFAAAPSLESLAAYQWIQLELRGGGEPMRSQGVMTSASLFHVLQAAPALGRVFDGAEDSVGHERVVVLSHALWTSRFGTDPGVVGRRLELGGMPASIVGVMPAGFEFPGPADFWVPLQTSQSARAAQNRRVHTLACVGRLGAGATPEQAQAELEAILQRAERDHPQEDAGHHARALPLHEARVRDLRAVFQVLAGAVAFLLLIACANVANLLLARLPLRGRELAIRAALGASRGRLVRQAGAEALLLALFGGALGLALAGLSLDVLRNFDPDPRLQGALIDLRVAGFALAVALATALVFGTAPAWAARGIDLVRALKSEAGSGGFSRRPQALRRLLIVGEAALSLVLLSGAGLMAASLARLADVDLGFRVERLLTLRVSLPAARYDDPARVVAAFREAQDRLESLPGVEASSAVSTLPITGGESSGELSTEGREVAVGARPSASFRRVLPGYFDTLGIPLLAGRDFDDGDDGRGPFVVIVNASLARGLWPDGRAIGRRIKVGPPEGEPWLTVVGVVADVRHAGLESEPGFATFEPVAQRPRSSLRFAVRTRQAAEGALATIRSTLRSWEPELVLDEAQTMEARLERSLRPRRFQTWLLGAFALTALCLSGVGLFGLVAYSVSRRTREIGIRVTLGARRRDVVRLVLREGLALAGAGSAIGLLAAAWLTRLLEGLLFQVRPADPATLAGAAGLLLTVALLACALTAYRAAGIDPASALRNE